MRKHPVVYLRKAQLDLIRISEYIRQDSPTQAVAWTEKVDHVLERLAHFPKSGVIPKDKRLAALGYRMVIMDEYLAFYILRLGRVEIRRIIHGSQRYSFLL